LTFIDEIFTRDRAKKTVIAGPDSISIDFEE
jgi:hypothetical protein